MEAEYRFTLHVGPDGKHGEVTVKAATEESLMHWFSIVFSSLDEAQRRGSSVDIALRKGEEWHKIRTLPWSELCNRSF